MNKKTMDKIDEHIVKSKKIPKEEVKKLRKKLIINTIISACLFAVLGIIYIVINNFEPITMLFTSWGLAIFLLISTIAIFEYAYKKDSGFISIYGIESAILGLFVLSVPYIFAYMQEININTYIIIATCIVLAYFTIKTLVVFIKGRSSYFKNQNDIKEIVKK